MGIINQAIEAVKSHPELCRIAKEELRQEIWDELEPYVAKGIVQVEFPKLYLAVVTIKGYGPFYFELKHEWLTEKSRPVWMELTSNDGGASRTIFSLEEGLKEIGIRLAQYL